MKALPVIHHQKEQLQVRKQEKKAMQRMEERYLPLCTTLVDLWL
jgi:hypothetical protein